MHGRQHRDRLLRGINAEEMLGKLADLGQALAQLSLAEVAHVEMHGLAMRGGDGAALTFLRAKTPG